MKKPQKGAHVLPKISEEMKQWSAMLGTELSDWPQVASKPMFGMTAYYRGAQIFAVLPKTRAFGTANGVAFRFDEISKKLADELKGDARVLTNPIGKKWITFEVKDAKDLNAALEWMSRAFESRKPVRAKAKPIESKKSGRSANPKRSSTRNNR
jgi:hypothetical protein